MNKSEELRDIASQVNSVENKIAKIYEVCKRAAQQGHTKIDFLGKDEIGELLTSDKDKQAIIAELQLQGITVSEADGSVVLDFTAV